MAHVADGKSVICKGVIWPLDVSSGILISWSVSTLVLSLFVVSSNMALIFAMVKTGDTKSITSNLVIIMSLSDMGIGLVVLPMLFAMVTFKAARVSCGLQVGTQFLAFLLGYISFFMLLAIAVDRYVRMTRLMTYQSVVTTFRIKCLVIVIMLVSLALALVSILAFSFYLHILTIIANVVSIGAVYILYASMLINLEKQSIQIPRSEIKEISTLKKNKRLRSKRDMAVAKTVKILLGMILVLYVPYDIISPIWTHTKLLQKKTPSSSVNVLVFWAYFILFSNSMANAVVYGYGNSKIRKYFKKLICKEGDQNNADSASRSIQETSSFHKKSKRLIAEVEVQP